MLSLSDVTNMDEEQVYALYTGLRNDKELFAKTIMGHIVKEVPPYQRDIYQLLNSNYQHLCIIVYRGGGKRLALDAKVLTPTGWVENKDLKVGDYVIGSDGKPTKIFQMSDTVYRDLYRLTTRDGRSVLCDPDHLWKVVRLSGGAGYYKGRKILMTTQDLLNFPYKAPRLDKRYGKDNMECMFGIEYPDPIQWSAKDYEVDPYDLGVILGDGNISKDTGFVRIHSSKDDVYETYMHMAWEDKSEIRFNKLNNGAVFSLYGSGTKMKKFGMFFNVYGKFIPEEYLFGSVEQRLALLQGLMDTDGTCSKSKRGAVFCTVSPQLRDDVVHLVRSLGGTTTVSEGKAPLSTCIAYNINVILPEQFTPFRMARKACIYRPGKLSANAITNIEFVKKDYGRCIMVDALDHLFVTEDFLLTHNSTLGHTIDTTHDICNQLSPYTIFLSETLDQASADLISVQDELEANDMLKALYGDLAGTVWNKESMEARNGCYVMCRGTGSKIRGLKWKNQRPTKIKLDDTESEANTTTARQREVYSRWIFTNVLRAGMPGQTQFQFFGTIVHPDAFLAKAKDMDMFKGSSGRYLEIPVETNGVPAWPKMFPMSYINTERERYAAHGKLPLFLQEMYHIPYSSGKASFNTEMIKMLPATYRCDHGVSYLLQNDVKIPLNVYMGVDPADTDSESADDTSVTVIGVLPSKAPGRELIKFVILDIQTVKMTPSGVVDKIAQMADLYKPKVITFEIQGGRAAYVDLLRLAMRQRGTYHAIKPFKTNVSKTNKWLNGLEPYINGGYVNYLATTQNVNILKTQLENYNSEVRDHDDCIDSLFLAKENAYAPQEYDVDVAIRSVLDIKDAKKPAQVVNWYTL